MHLFSLGATPRFQRHRAQEGYPSVTTSRRAAANPFLLLLLPLLVPLMLLVVLLVVVVMLLLLLVLLLRSVCVALHFICCIPAVCATWCVGTFFARLRSRTTACCVAAVFKMSIHSCLSRYRHLCGRNVCCCRYLLFFCKDFQKKCWPQEILGIEWTLTTRPEP